MNCRALLLGLGVALSVVAYANEESTDFLRFIEGDQGAALQSAIVSYTTAEGIRVDLVGAVHMADRAYFDALNQRFIHYDAVLYERVGRPVTDETEEARAGEPSPSPSKLRWLGQLQESIRRMLELESQLEQIDYRARNFVHADMSVETFLETQSQRQESLFSLWRRVLNAQKNVEPSSQPGLMDLLKILTGKDSANGLKRWIGRSFDQMEPLLNGLEADGGTVLIGERNRHAINVLHRELNWGKRRLAIFYGVAHLPDFEKRLQQMKFKRQSAEWLTAWELPPESR